MAVPPCPDILTGVDTGRDNHTAPIFEAPPDPPAHETGEIRVSTLFIVQRTRLGKPPR
jgi:hypothetical protein